MIDLILKSPPTFKPQIKNLSIKGLILTWQFTHFYGDDYVVHETQKKSYYICPQTPT